MVLGVDVCDLELHGWPLTAIWRQVMRHAGVYGFVHCVYLRLAQIHALCSYHIITHRPCRAAELVERQLNTRVARIRAAIRIGTASANN